MDEYPMLLVATSLGDLGWQQAIYVDLRTPDVDREPDPDHPVHGGGELVALEGQIEARTSA